MTAPPPGVDVKPMWRGKDFLRWGAVGAASGATAGILLSMLLAALLGEWGEFDPSSIGTWIGLTLLGVGLAWMPGSARASGRSRAALYGTDDEVARLKYRVLHGRPLQLTPDETLQGRYLARVTYFSALGEVASTCALLPALAVLTLPRLLEGKHNPLDYVSVIGASLLVAGCLVLASRRRQNARRFLDETTHQEGVSSTN